jgi:hypothetical protein
LLETWAFDTDAGAYLAPQLFQVGVAEYFTLLVKKPPPADNCACLLYGLAYPERPQHSNTIGMEQDTCPGGVPYWAAFNQLYSEALPVQGYGKSEPGDTSADDQAQCLPSLPPIFAFLLEGVSLRKLSPAAK